MLFACLTYDTSVQFVWTRSRVYNVSGLAEAMIQCDVEPRSDKILWKVAPSKRMSWLAGTRPGDKWCMLVYRRPRIQLMKRGSSSDLLWETHRPEGGATC